MTSTRLTPRAVTSQSASAVPILQVADWWGSLTRRRDPSCLSLRVQRLRELPLKMLERPLDLFPNNKIVDKTLITIEQIFAVHYEKPFFPLFSRFAGEPRWARATRERRGERGGGGGEREEDVTPRESRETGKPVLLHACLKNVDNPRTKICFSDSNYRKSKGALLCEKTKISFLLRHLEHFGRLLKKKKKKKR